MIQENELRIGNWVQVGDNTELQSIVIAIGSERCHLKGNAILNKYEQLTPIPLTEEILLKCGFKEIQSKWFYINYITDCKETLEEIQIQYNLMTGRCGILDTDIVGIAFLRKPIQYLHQLQNLYFALTNTELKVNL